MRLKRLGPESVDDLVKCFTTTFGASEGVDEGILIGRLVAKLSADIDDLEICCFGAVEREQLIAAIFFSRLHFPDGASVYMLAPVAVSPPHQGSGVGTALIRYGLEALFDRGERVALTYGNPAYYERFGFKPISEHVLAAPLELSMPHGWLGLSFTDQPIQARTGRPTCVDAFRDPAYW